MSIFQQKFCPQCSDRQPLSAPRCGCGYLFEVDQVEDETHAAELQAQQERIYLDYLAARAAQAEEAYRVAKRLLEADPESVVKSADVLVAQQQMHAAQAELSAQTIKTRAAVARAETLRRSKPAGAASRNAEAIPPKRPEPAAPPAISGTAPARDMATPAPGPRNAAAEQPRQDSPPETPAPRRPATTKPVVADSPALPPVTAKAHAAVNAPAAAAAAGAQPRQRPTAATASAMPQERPNARRDPGAATATPRGEPGPAARIATASPLQPSVPAAIPQPGVGQSAPVPARCDGLARAAAPSAQPTPAFRAAQAAKARDILGRREGGAAPSGPTRVEAAAAAASRASQPATSCKVEETKECPSCTAVVALAVMRCRCGFAFSAGAELPAVVLTPAERAALLQGFELTGPRKLA